MSNAPRIALPAWIDIGVIPLLNILMALVAAGAVILIIGEDPIQAVQVMIQGAIGYDEGLGYTLYYTTNFIFTGLAVSMAFHAGLFNIGGEGQAYFGGLGIGLAVLALDGFAPGFLIIPIAIAGGALFGAGWAFIPAYLQAYRGSHIVITTIMFNFIAAALMVYLLAGMMRESGNMSPETREFAAAAFLPFMHEIFSWFGVKITRTPLNLSLVWALLCCVGVYVFIWRTRWGYELRTVGQSERAAVYAGISPPRIVLMAMCLSGALAGFVGVNELLGVQHRLLLNFSAGYGFTGIAVALMGRNHPVGIILASLLFGLLYQGGAELAFEMPSITKEMVVALQGLVILFSGALAYMSRPWVERVYVMAGGGRVKRAA
ncbi:ABC transporter permease [Hwanghaeella sp.]|uniref:ABC transporter permease n=1 Tax=Hwanghaeella sp. TaxID=2605943 RepID=UPI003CCBCAE2